MLLLLLLITALHAVPVSSQTATSAPTAPTQHIYKEGNAYHLPINETATEELLTKWLSQAFSGLMAAVASSRLNQLDPREREEVHHCSKAASTVPEHARCVVKVLDKSKPVWKTKSERSAELRKSKRLHRFKSRTIANAEKSFSKLVKKEKKTRKPSWIGNFRIARTKREILSRSSYNISFEDDDTLFTKVARKLTKTIRSFKDKPGMESWRSAVQRIKKVGAVARALGKRRKELKRRLRHWIENTPDEFKDPRKDAALNQMEAAERKARLEKLLAKHKGNEVKVPMRILRESIKQSAHTACCAGTVVELPDQYECSLKTLCTLLDQIIDKTSQCFHSLDRKMNDFIEKAMLLIASGKNVTNFDKKTIKLISPRFLSLVPEQDDDELFNVLSPSLFSLHQEGDEVEKAMSLHHMLKQLPNKDQEAWLDFIVEAAGVTDAVDKAENVQKSMREREMLNEDGVPLYFTKENATAIVGDIEKRKIETFEALDRSYTIDQRDDLERLGYAFLNTKQLNIVYGPDSPYNKSDSLKLFMKLRRYRDDPHHLIDREIRLIAEAKKFGLSRRKQLILSPVLLTWVVLQPEMLSQPIILSPLLLSPAVLCPSVLGPIILSPWAFAPLILSPRVLGPLIVNPIMFSPLILSPLVLNPFILVPGVFDPLILNPLALSPLILSPQVFSPLILCPMVLNPLILTPMAGSPLILSPFVLSPIIVSPQFLTALVLSPYALSPVIESKLIAAEVVLSPSWLS